MIPVLTGYSAETLSRPLTAAIIIWSRSRSPPRFLFIGLNLSSRRVMLFFRYAPAIGVVDGSLYRERARLDELRPVEESEVVLEGLHLPRVDRDHVHEAPVVLGGQPDALGVGYLPHHGGVDGAPEVDVELCQLGLRTEELGHLAITLTAARSWPEASRRWRRPR